MTDKSHLALILPIAIREPRETKKQIFGFPWDTNPQPPVFWLIYRSLVYYIIIIIMQYKK